MYFVWESRRRSRDEALIPKFAPIKKDHSVSFHVGRRLRAPLPELEVLMDKDGPGRLTDDLVIRKRRCLVFSDRLVKVLRDAGVDNIDYYAVRVVNPVTGETWQHYKAANILDMIYCLDREASELEIDDEEPNEIWAINNLKLAEDRLGDVLMFRLGERRSVVLVHESVKAAVEEAHITGAVFLPADGYRDYQGYAFNNPRNVMGTHDEDPDGPPTRGLDDSDDRADNEGETSA